MRSTIHESNIMAGRAGDGEAGGSSITVAVVPSRSSATGSNVSIPCNIANTIRAVMGGVFRSTDARAFSLDAASAQGTKARAVVHGAGPMGTVKLLSQNSRRYTVEPLKMTMSLIS